MRTHLAQSSDLESIANTNCRLILKMPQASPSDIGPKSLFAYFAHTVPVKFAHPHLLIILTEPACHHNSFCGSRCESNHAPTNSLKPCISFAEISAIPSTHDTFYHTAYLITSNGHQVHFPTVSAIFSPNSLHVNRLSTQKHYKQPKVQITSITQITAQCMNQF